MITVTAAIIEKEGRILAARRKPGKHLAGFWEFPGGKLEAGESEETCLQRELAEEFGIQTKVESFFTEAVHNYGETCIRLRCYRVRHISGEFHCTDHDEICWLKPAELSGLRWSPADVGPLELLQQEFEQRALQSQGQANSLSAKSKPTR